MSADIILDDWALPVSIDIQRSNRREYEIDREKLDKNIQQNREIVQRMRDNKKYAGILQKV